MGKLIHSERISDFKGAGNVALMATIVFEGGSNVPAVDSMGRHVGSLVRRHMDDNSSAGWSEGSFVKIEISIQAGVGR